MQQIDQPLQPPGLLLGFSIGADDAHGQHDGADENPDDRDDHEQLEQREAALLERGADELVEIPVTDVGIDAFAAFLAISAIREDVELSVLTWKRVLVGMVPGVHGQFPGCAFQFGAWPRRGS